MMTISAPYPAFSGQIVLPSPEWGDFQRQQHTVIIKRDMFGVVIQTFKRITQDNDTLSFEMKMTRHKSLELLEFYRIYIGEKMLLINHHNVEYIGHLKMNPLELEKSARSLVGSSVEEITVRFEFEEIE
jgi:hypothetical protein